MREICAPATTAVMQPPWISTFSAFEFLGTAAAPGNQPAFSAQ